MKNIHILPTDKPSRIYLIKSNNKLGITSNNPEFTENFGSGTQNQNIYITNDEEIKLGDWVTNGKKYAINCYIDWWVEELKSDKYIYPYKKIILTTSKYLIENGVQAIDDEFLEWFVQNPSCEEVFLTNDFEQVNQDNPILRGSTNVVHKYKIIIPKEESKKI